MTVLIAPVIPLRAPDEDNWAAWAGCKGHPEPDIWSADETSNDPWHQQAKVDAKEICKTACPVRRECLRFALRRHEPTLIWGGLGPRERTRMIQAYGSHMEALRHA